MSRDIKPAMDLLTISEGSSQLKVLSVIAEYQLDENKEAPRQVDITNKLALTKGSVSNNCNELEDIGIIKLKDKGYHINKEVMLKTYQEYIENLLIREPIVEGFEEEVERANESRTSIRNNLKRSFNLVEDRLYKIILNVLSTSRKVKAISNLREVFEKTNASIRLISNIENIEISDEKKSVLKDIGIATNVHYQFLK